VPSRAFADQLERVRPSPKVPEWERIFQEMQLTAERVVQRQQSSEAAAAELDAWTDAVLEKRRWLRARALRAPA
jgi:multiple sugar transport system substrate-binding protein